MGYNTKRIIVKIIVQDFWIRIFLKYLSKKPLLDYLQTKFRKNMRIKKIKSTLKNPKQHTALRVITRTQFFIYMDCFQPRVFWSSGSWSFGFLIRAIRGACSSLGSEDDCCRLAMSDSNGEVYSSIRGRSVLRWYVDRRLLSFHGLFYSSFHGFVQDCIWKGFLLAYCVYYWPLATTFWQKPNKF